MDERNANVLRSVDMTVGAGMADVEGLGGEQLFVINLCAAMTPINLDGQKMAGLEQYKLYQVSRMEDGRRRFRLRLGFFNTEADAEDVLASVRGRYATAFTSCLCEEDLKHATGYLKCTVQDLQRTGRYAVPKFVSTGSTTALKALDASAIRKLRAAEAQSTQRAKAADADEIVEVDWQPEAHAAPKTKPSATHTATHTSTTKVAPKPAAVVPSPVVATAVVKAPPIAAAPKQPAKPATLADLVGSAKPQRESLMRRAHAMADVDAAERAKAIPQSSADVDVSATGKFKLPQPPQPRAPQTPATMVSTGQFAAAKVAPAPAVVAQPAAPKAPTAPDLGATGRFKMPAATPMPAAAPKSELQASTPPKHTTIPSPHQKNQPFHVGAGVKIPETALSLAPSEPQKNEAVKVAHPTTVAPVVPDTISPDLMRVRELAKQSAQWRQGNGEVPTLDTTQTIRALTKKELEDANSARWFAVQLAISDHPANLDTMPRLDIFEAYSLYSVATMDDGSIRHALRLGFFKEEVSAEAVTGYLKTFFPGPTIVQIPVSEHDRFLNAPKLSAIRPAANVVTLEKPKEADPVPTVNATVDRTPPKSVPRSAAPAVKKAAPAKTSAKKPVKAKTTAHTPQDDLVEEARLLGLSDTQIIRVQKNPSLLERLVGKIGK